MSFLEVLGVNLESADILEYLDYYLNPPNNSIEFLGISSCEPIELSEF